MNEVGSDIHSGGDITVRLTGDYNHSGVFRAAGNASLVTAGNIVNHAAMEAGQTLHLSAAHITNLTDATLSGDTTELNAAVSLLNRGLIDGRETRISTAELLNAGRGRQPRGHHHGMACGDATAPHRAQRQQHA